MLIVSFARDNGHHVSRFGSDFILSPVMGSSDAARTVFMHLSAGGCVGEHEATMRQLFCVISGSGWVSGADGKRVPIGVFEAAHWEAGELHAAGTDSGLVAAVIEGDFTGRRPAAAQNRSRSQSLTVDHVARRAAVRARIPHPRQCRRRRRPLAG